MSAMEVDKPPSPGRAINVGEAEKEYLGEAGTEAPPTADQLAVKEVNFELDRNRDLHHTAEYELKNLFVRRGQDFDIDVTFNRAPKTETFSLELTVQGAHVSSINRGTIIRLPFDRSTENAGDWGVRIGSAEGAKYSLVVVCPPDAIVGRYTVTVLINDTADAVPRKFPQLEPIYVLFNAWCEKDAVYMPGDVEKGEYVLNDTGYVFTGTASKHQQYARPWVFGQFEDTVTKVIFDTIQKYIRDNGRRDPVVVVRKLTSLVNYMPQWGHPETSMGILVGNWSGDYEDGTSPSKWTGSTKIYETYAETGEPVKYGQCWVFSGVLNTALRCLGIPARSVTNFASAHDTDASMTIDSCYDSVSFEEVDYLSSDSVWNFHVWNEAWMARPDLVEGYGGWQVVDATPQETSEGVYQTGPAPKTAIKQGNTYLSYDTKFCFAEVNADKILWLVTKKGSGKPDMKVARVIKNAVGKYISTKKLPVNGTQPSRWFAREDITLEYKFPEDSAEERLAVERAVSFGTKPNVYRKDKKADDVEMEIVLAEKIPVGSDIELKVTVNNGSSVERNIDLIIVGHVCYYTGVKANNLQREKMSLKVASGKSEHTLGTIHAKTYAGKLVDQSSIKLYVSGKVQETQQLVQCQDFVQLTPPEMKTDAKVVGHEVDVNVEFVNPLPIALTNCTIGFEGARFLRHMTLYPSDVPAKGKFTQRMKFTPRSKGKKTLIIDFDSKQIGNITDVIDIEIK